MRVWNIFSFIRSTLYTLPSTLLFALLFYPLPSTLYPSHLYAGELRGSFGLASYQYEGAGSTGGIWEEKPSFNNQPHVEMEYRWLPEITHYAGFDYFKAGLEYLGGKSVRMADQAIYRKVETMNVFFGLGRTFSGGMGFEFGPMAVKQEHEVKDLSGNGSRSLSLLRLGSYFGYSWHYRFDLWQAGIFGYIGVAGLPQRQSALSSFSFSVWRKLSGSAWSLGAKFSGSLFQMERANSIIGDVGTTKNAVLLFRQGETDFRSFALTIGRSI
ncbi:MAG: hypothetical protein HY747_03155 [Elusimicrobia bacterium]|nr:hypothetical protein [Elusimicrobiota bacterium]